MPENEELFLAPYSIDVISVNAKFLQKEKKFKYLISVFLQKRDNDELDFEVCYSIKAEYDFSITFDIIASYDDEEIVDMLDDDFVDLSIKCCYPIYAKAVTLLTAIMDQMNIVPFIPSYPSFVESISIKK